MERENETKSYQQKDDIPHLELVVGISPNSQEMVTLLAEIIVDLTFKQAYEKGNSLLKVQQ